MGSGFESQGAHFKQNPADSSESAGFLRSPNFIDFGLRYRYPIALVFDAWKTVFALVPTGDPSSLRFGHPDVTTGDTVFLAWLPGAAAGDICTSVCIGIRGTLRSRRGCGRYAVVQYVRPVPSELWRGRLSRFSLLRGGWCFVCGAGRAVAVWSATWRLNVWAGAPCFPEAPSGCHTDALRSEARRGGASG